MGKSLKKSVSDYFKDNGLNLTLKDAALAIGVMTVTFTVLKFLDENDIPSKIIKWIKDLPKRLWLRSENLKGGTEKK